MNLFVEKRKKKRTHSQNRNRFTDLEGELMVAGEEDGGNGYLRSLGWTRAYCCI